MSKKFNASDFILNKEVFKERYYFGDEFALDSGVSNVWDTTLLDRDIRIKTINKHKMGNNNIACPPGAREWGYNFFLTKQMLAGDGARSGGGGFSKEPKDREEALLMLKKEIFELYGLENMTDWESMTGHFPWQHYSCEWGCTSIGSEVGESICSPQTRVAFCRGASRQYDIPWFLQFSFWHWGRITDYSGKAMWGECSRENGGHSSEFYKRMFLMTYMGNGSHFYPEANFQIAFFNEFTEDNLYKLSPVGEMTCKLNDFILRNSDIGTSYSPFGIVLDKYHGMFPGIRLIKPKKAFQVFEYTDGDDMTQNIFEMFYPGSCDLFVSNEATFLVNGPFGNTADVLLQGVSEEVINAYPCIILTGDMVISKEEEDMYKRYVQNGGTLILNTKYIENVKYNNTRFPEYAQQYNGRKRCDIVDGKGKVIIYGPSYNQTTFLAPILKEQLAKHIPFEISEQVDFMVNVKENSLIITLMNNSGYYYNFDNGEDIDYSETKNFTLTYTGDCEVKAVKELWYGEELEGTNSLKVNLKPAEVKIYEFEF